MAAEYSANLGNFLSVIEEHYKNPQASDAFLTMNYGDKVSVLKLAFDQQKKPLIFHYDCTQGKAFPEPLKNELANRYQFIDVSGKELLEEYRLMQLQAYPERSVLTVTDAQDKINSYIKMQRPLLADSKAGSVSRVGLFGKTHVFKPTEMRPDQSKAPAQKK